MVNNIAYNISKKNIAYRSIIFFIVFVNMSMFDQDFNLFSIRHFGKTRCALLIITRAVNLITIMKLEKM